MLRSPRSLLFASAAAVAFMGLPAASFVAPAFAQANIVTNAPFPPPSLPIYAQPPIPGLGYLWVPGYWAWDGSEYYWVPGYWQEPPEADLYWTPGYWAWDPIGHVYVFNTGYWAQQVGYYGGINYGFGYTGVGYSGGYWRNNAFVYNRALNNLRAAKVPTFANQVTPSPSHVSFNGGAQGTTAKPTEAELAAARANHVAMTAAQVQHQKEASSIGALRYNENKGAPPVTVTPTASDLHGASRSELPLAHSVAGAPAAGPRVDNATQPLASMVGRRPTLSPIRVTGMTRNLAAAPMTTPTPATAPDYAIQVPWAAHNRAFQGQAHIGAPAYTRIAPPPAPNFAVRTPSAPFGAAGGAFPGVPVQAGAPNVRIAIPPTPGGATAAHIGAGPHFGQGLHSAPIQPGAPNIANPGMHIGGGMHGAGFPGGPSGGAIGAPVTSFRAP